MLFTRRKKKQYKNLAPEFCANSQILSFHGGIKLAVELLPLICENVSNKRKVLSVMHLQQPGVGHPRQKNKRKSRRPGTGPTGRRSVSRDSPGTGRTRSSGGCPSSRPSRSGSRWKNWRITPPADRSTSQPTAGLSN